MYKTWNVRDQTEETLRTEAESLYKEIESSYKVLRKLSKYEDVKEMVDSIWNMKAQASDIELELLRREYSNGKTQ